jgi:hypothetical protein
VFLAFGDALTATAILNAPAIKSKCANIHRNAFFLFFVLADWFFFHALPALHRRISFSPRLFIRGLHVAMPVQTISSVFRLSGSRVGCIAGLAVCR